MDSPKVLFISESIPKIATVRVSMIDQKLNQLLRFKYLLTQQGISRFEHAQIINQIILFPLNSCQPLSGKISTKIYPIG